MSAFAESIVEATFLGGLEALEDAYRKLTRVNEPSVVERHNAPRTGR